MLFLQLQEADMEFKTLNMTYKINIKGLTVLVLSILIVATILNIASIVSAVAIEGGHIPPTDTIILVRPVL
jgi:hypothetical protein